MFVSPYLFHIGYTEHIAIWDGMIHRLYKQEHNSVHTEGETTVQNNFTSIFACIPLL